MALRDGLVADMLRQRLSAPDEQESDTRQSVPDE